jgi:hypothetical protein
MISNNLKDFLKKIEDDPVITAKHISLYLSLFGGRGWDPTKSVALNRVDLMRRSKISGRSTYYRCLRDLHEQGYIRYRPARHRWDESLASPRQNVFT